MIQFLTASSVFVNIYRFKIYARVCKNSIKKTFYVLVNNISS